MARALRFLPIVALAAGTALLVDAIARGTAHASLVLIVPVITGTSGEFLVGVLLVFVGLVLLPLLGAGETTVATRWTDPAEPGSGRLASGGVVFVGPVPIFFGEWGKAVRRTYWWWVALASLLLSVALVAWLWFLLR